MNSLEDVESTAPLAIKGVAESQQRIRASARADTMRWVSTWWAKSRVGVNLDFATGTIALLLGAGYAWVLSHWFLIQVAWHDVGLVLNGAERLLAGQVPFRDFFSVQAPGSSAALALAFVALGSNTSTLLACVWGLGGLLALLGWAAGRSFTGPAPALLVACATVALSLTWWAAPTHHWWTALWLGAAAIAAACAGKAAGRSGAALLVCAGLCVGLGAWGIPHVATLCALLLAGAVALNAEGGARFRSAILVLAGSAAPVGIAVAWLACNGALDQAVYALFVFPLQQYAPSHGGMQLFLEPPIPLAFSVDTPRKVVAMLLGLAVAVLAAPIYALAAARALSRRSGNERCRSAALPIVAVGLGQYLAALYHPDTLHFLFASTLLPAVCAFLAVAMLPHRWLRGVAVAIAFALGLIFAPLGEMTLILRSETLTLASPRGPVPVGAFDDLQRYASDQAQLLEVVGNAARAGDVLVGYPNLSLYNFLLGLPNPTRFDSLLSGHHSAVQFEQAILDMARTQPRWVLVDEHDAANLAQKAGERATAADFEEMLARSYRERHRAGQYVLLERIGNPAARE